MDFTSYKNERYKEFWTEASERVINYFLNDELKLMKIFLSTTSENSNALTM